MLDIPKQEGDAMLVVAPPCSFCRAADPRLCRRRNPQRGSQTRPYSAKDPRHWHGPPGDHTRIELLRAVGNPRSKHLCYVRVWQKV